jgi:CRISPR-associated protein (TIGR03984 family)
MSDFIKNDVELPESGKLQEWIEKQLKAHEPTLLAFADDGVIWGKLVNDTLSLSPNAPELREKTLQQASIFNADCEVRLFRDELFTDDNPKWKCVRIVDGSDKERVIPESQILWGNEAKGPAENGFIYASEYRAGIPGQWLPLNEPFGSEKCARLEVHHLVEFDDKTGEARIVASRLAGLLIGKRAMEVEK